MKVLDWGFLITYGGFTERLNKKFTIKAKSANHTSVLAIDPVELARHFAIENIRTVRNDYTVQLNNVVYQLSKNQLLIPI